jgi:hypothetical protein
VHGDAPGTARRGGGQRHSRDSTIRAHPNTDDEHPGRIHDEDHRTDSDIHASVFDPDQTADSHAIAGSVTDSDGHQDTVRGSSIAHRDASVALDGYADAEDIDVQFVLVV